MLPGRGILGGHHGFLEEGREALGEPKEYKLLEWPEHGKREAKAQRLV